MPFRKISLFLGEICLNLGLKCNVCNLVSNGSSKNFSHLCVCTCTCVLRETETEKGKANTVSHCWIQVDGTWMIYCTLLSTFLSKVLKINWELNFWGNWQSEKKLISGKTEALLFLINPIIVIGAPLCPSAPTWMAGALTTSLWSQWT